MKKEDLEARITHITKEAEQAFSIYHKLLGHLGEAKFILDELNKQEDNEKFVDNNQSQIEQAAVCS